MSSDRISRRDILDDESVTSSMVRKESMQSAPFRSSDGHSMDLVSAQNRNGDLALQAASSPASVPTRRPGDVSLAVNMLHRRFRPPSQFGLPQTPKAKSQPGGDSPDGLDSHVSPHRLEFTLPSTRRPSFPARPIHKLPVATESQQMSMTAPIPISTHLDDEVAAFLQDPESEDETDYSLSLPWTH